MNPALLPDDPVERIIRQRGLKSIAEEVGVSVSMLSYVFRGHRQPSMNTLRKISRALGLSLQALDTFLCRVRENPQPSSRIAARERREAWLKLRAERIKERRVKAHQRGREKLAKSLAEHPPKVA